MKVILKQDIKGIGRKYEVKNVADGYANNFLLPQKMAEFATADAVKKAEELKKTAIAEIEIRESLAEKQIEILKGIKITLTKKASDKGHLFEKIHSAEIAEALKSQAHINIDAEFLKTEKPIKEVGEHAVLAEVGKSKGEFILSVESV